MWLWLWLWEAIATKRGPLEAIDLPEGSRRFCVPCARSLARRHLCVRKRGEEGRIPRSDL